MEPSPLFAVIFTALVGVAALADIDSEIDYRLPEDIVPSSYKMLLIPEFADFTFTGVSGIEITVKRDNTRRIILHAKELAIESATVSKDDRKISVEWAVDITTDFLTLTLDEEINAGNYVLKLEYKGKLRDDGKGFYWSSYTDDEGNDVLFAATYFVPTNARYAFPCWDEPALKATFDISIKHPSNYKALSNAAELSRETAETDATQVITKFAKTPEMSTYLVAFIVSDLEPLSDGNLSIWARKSVVKNGKFALEFGKQAWRQLEKITGITQEEIGIRKIDFVAFPTFSNGAMENWGLITCSESGLLIEENSITNTAVEQQVAILVSNQLAHQWFGNLVTPVWWKYLWLTEGISAYFQYELPHKIFQKQRTLDQHVIEKLVIDQDIAFIVDSSSGIHALNVDVSSPDEIAAIFDGISFSKASSIIRMIHHILGEEPFLIALRSYLNKMKGRAVTPTDLFEEFAAVFTGTSNLISVLNHWANTPGYPVVSVIRDYAAGTATLTQKRFLDQPDETHEKFYFVPINYATQGERNFDVTTVSEWLNNDDGTTVLDGGFAEDEWVIFNKQEFGYYRVNYDNENWRLIIEFLKSEDYADIHVLNRAQLIDDAMNLAKIGLLDYNIALNLLGYLEHEVDPIPWFSALTTLSDLRGRLANTGHYDSFKSYIVGLLDIFLEHINYEDSPEDGWVQKYIRGEAVKLACRLGSETCRDHASKKVINWLDDHEVDGFSPDMMDSLLCAGMYSVDEAAWNRLFEEYLNNNITEHLAALVCTSNEELLKNLFKKTLVRHQSLKISDVLRYVFEMNEDGMDIVLDLFVENRGKIMKIIGCEDMTFLANYIPAKITTEAQLGKLEKFLADNPDLDDSLIASCIETAENRIRWISSHEQEFVGFFETAV